MVGQIDSPTPRNEDSINSLRKLLPDSLKTQILILGTPHLITIGENFQQSLLDSLLIVLEQFRPDIIGVESIPPHLIEYMDRKGGYYAQVVKQFSKDNLEYGEIAQDLLNLTRLEAKQKADSLLHSFTKQNPISEKSRLDLVLILLASYDLNSALLQWSYLTENIRLNNETFPSTAASFLNERLEAPNEIPAIGIRLGKKLGLNKISSIDDHQDKDLFLEFAPDLIKQIQSHPLYKTTTESPIYIDSQNRLKEAIEKGDLLPYYRYLNSNDYTKKDTDTQWGLFLRTNLESGLDRSRMALWEVRNLNIVSHIRRVTVLNPGKRMLVIIGVGHKPFLESYLNKMIDVKLVHFEEL
ncbi:MAG: hypothetical protein IIA61_08555 [Candidatus Marinimicrobia bacterium]|nr:hypothetical protein [Candidatus Neomarinimicrobiota bacterium]